MTSVRLDHHADHVRKVNALLEAGRDELAHELADTLAAETAGSPSSRHLADRRAPARRRRDRLTTLTRRSWERFDRYTLDVFNAGSPYRDSDRSA